MLAMLPQQGVYYFCAAAIPRALPAGELAAQANSLGLQGVAYESVAMAIAAARAAAHPQDAIFIGGSTFVVAEVSELYASSPV